MPLDATAAAFEQMMLARHGAKPTTLDAAEPGEPDRRLNGRPVFDHLRSPDRLAQMIRDYWRREGYEVDVRIERIRDTRDHIILSDLDHRGLPTVK